MNRFGITLKLTLIFIFFAGAVLTGLGIPAYITGRAALENAIRSELLATAIEKAAALETWIEEREHTISDISKQPGLQEGIAALLESVPGSKEHDQAYNDVVNYLLIWAGEGHRFGFLEVIDAESGQVILSTDSSEEGKFREYQPYFINGLKAAYVQNPYYDLQKEEPVMTAATPIISPLGRLLGVLAGPLNLDEMNAIIQRRSGLHQTDDFFLLNTSKLIVTQPRLIPDSAVLQRGLQAEAIDLCLSYRSGIINAPDYRGVPAIVVYRWLVDRQMCLIVKMDQAEGLAPSQSLSHTMMLISGLVLLAGSLMGMVLSRSFSLPIRQLAQAAEQIEEGDLETQIDIKSNDEIGMLGKSFNKMAIAIHDKETQLRNWAAELEQKVNDRTAALSESENQYRALSETSPDMIFVIDNQDKVQYVNNLAAKMFGKKSEKVIGKSRKELFPPAIAESQGKGLAQVFKTGKPLSSESQIIFPNGTRWLDTQLVPLLDPAGEVRAVMGVSRDTTERKQAEQQIQEEKNLSDSIINSLPGIFYIFDMQGKFLRWNRNFEIVSGYSAEEMLERNPADFFMGDEKYKVQERIEQVFTSGQAYVEAYFTSRSGVATPYYLTGVRVQIDGQPHLVGVGLDITELKQAEEALKQINERFELATQSAGMGVWELDLLENRLTWDEQMFNLYGITEDIFSGAYEAWVQGIHPDDRERGNREVEQALNGEKEFDSEFRVIWPDGSIKTLKGNAYVVRDSSGKPVRLTGINYDITERKLAEEKIKTIMDDLARSNIELERFAYVASHDLQEPLRMVTSYLQLLEKRYKDKLDGDALEFINYAVDGSIRMKTLIGDLLAYSRVGTRGIEFSLTDCEEVLENVLGNLKVSIEESKAKLTHDALPKVMGDGAQLESLLQNLIGNAIKFHGKNSPKIHIGVVEKNKEWIFSVKDNGIGIDPQYFERIFIIFQRLHNKQDFSGTGIGLAISKRIVERHGGRMWIESQPDKGSTFYFTLPIQGESS